MIQTPDSILCNGAPELFARRRARLAKTMKNGVGIFRAQPYVHPTYGKQDGNILHFCGISCPGTLVIDFDSGESYFFVDELSLTSRFWGEYGPTKDDIKCASGVEHVLGSSELTSFINLRVIGAGRALHTLFATDWQNQEPSALLVEAVIQSRIYLSPGDIEQMRAAMVVTAKAHRAAMMAAAPGVRADQIATLYTAVLGQHGCRNSFAPTITVHGERLHAGPDFSTLQAGDALLVDGGGEFFNGLATDVTRLTPVGGPFSPAYAWVYQLVLDAKNEATSRLQSHVTTAVHYGDAHEIACRTIIRGLLEQGVLKGLEDDLLEQDAHALFFSHGLGHLIDFDTHACVRLPEDHVGYGDGKARRIVWKKFGIGVGKLRFNRRLATRDVDGETHCLAFSIEPGIYRADALYDDPEVRAAFSPFVDFDRARAILPFGGCRLEDHLVATPTGIDVISREIPIEVQDVMAIAGTRPELVDFLRN